MAKAKTTTKSKSTSTNSARMFDGNTVLAYSPRKARLIVDAIRGMRVDQAFEALLFMNKGQTKKVSDLIKNAVNNLGLTPSDYSQYQIQTIVAEEAQKYYRIEPRARGSAFRVRKRYSRVKLKLQKI